MILGYSNKYHSMCIVLLQQETEYVAQVSLLNFQAFAPEKVKDLVEVFDSGRRCKFYTYKLALNIRKKSIERWASWLTYRDLRAIDMNGPGNGQNIGTTLADAECMNAVDFYDALVDAWMLWLQDTEPAGKLNIGRLQRDVWFYYHDHFYKLRCALILHHDPDSVTIEDWAFDSESPYSKSACSTVHSLALYYFCQPKKEPKDPLQLSVDEFCKEYHSHHKRGLSCYKAKTLRKDA
jgi:hypothetical protein